MTIRSVFGIGGVIRPNGRLNQKSHRGLITQDCTFIYRTMYITERLYFRVHYINFSLPPISSPLLPSASQSNSDAPLWLGNVVLLAVCPTRSNAPSMCPTLVGMIINMKLSYRRRSTRCWRDFDDLQSHHHHHHHQNLLWRRSAGAQ